MKDAFRYQLVDEPKPGLLSRFALPPILVFLAAQFFLPWGFLLLAANAIALNGPARNREILFSLIPIGLYYLGLAILDTLVRGEVLAVNQAHYFFVIAIGIGLMFGAFAYVSQHQTAELRQYLSASGA